MKIIILTASIIRGDYHKYSIGDFYNKFDKYLRKFDIDHIIHIDQPVHLKKYFNVYETIDILNKLIPNYVNKKYILNDNPGFLNAYKNLVTKVKEETIIDDNNIFYWWLEDDWKCTNTVDVYNLANLSKNIGKSSIAFYASPLGSFGALGLMTHQYFTDYFDMVTNNVANDTCDPEKQFNRWISGINRKNGHQMIHRNIENDNIIQILFIYNNKDQIKLNQIPTWYYNNDIKFNKNLIFKYYVMVVTDNWENFECSIVDIEKQKYTLKNITFDNFIKYFDNYITYITVVPSCFADIGRTFNKKYDLNKWAKITDGTSYSSIEFYNVQLGNWKLLDEDSLRLKPEITMNKDFFSAFAYIHQCLPYLEKEYFNKDIFLNIMYYSHNYGSYPNFQVIGDVLQLNYKPSINIENKQFEELTCFSDLCRKICGGQQKEEDTTQYQSFKNNFTLANEYLFKYFKFNPSITEKVEVFTKQFDNKSVFGLHYRGTDNNKVNWDTHISIDEFIIIIDNHLKHNQYDVIFISTDDFQFVDKMKEKYSDNYTILFYDEEKNSDNKNSIHLNRLTVMENKTKEINGCKDDIDKLVTLEHELKLETQYNRILFDNVVVNSFILSKCDLVLKTHSQDSAYSKVFNPELEIYRVNACHEEVYWPDSHIPLYEYQNIDDIEVKNLLEKKLKNVI